MAQHNIAYLYGYLPVDPRIIYDDDGEIKRAEFFIKTALGTRPYKGEDEKDQYDTATILIRTGKKDMTEKIKDLKTLDLVFVKGTVTTKNISKKRKCSNCGELYKLIPSSGNGQDEEGKEIVETFLSTFVSPIDFEIVDSFETSEQAQQSIFDSREISNEVTLIGNLCSDPKRKKSGNKRVTVYNLGVNRKYYIEDDDPETTSDYPFVRAYGRQGKNDAHLLKKGSGVLIDGFIRTRRFTRTATCPCCGKEETFVDNTSEVVSYATEYLSNFLTEAEYQAQQEDLVDDLLTS